MGSGLFRAMAGGHAVAGGLRSRSRSRRGNLACGSSSGGQLWHVLLPRLGDGLRLGLLLGVVAPVLSLIGCGLRAALCLLLLRNAVGILWLALCAVTAASASELGAAWARHLCSRVGRASHVTAGTLGDGLLGLVRIGGGRILGRLRRGSSQLGQD